MEESSDSQGGFSRITPFFEQVGMLVLLCGDALKYIASGKINWRRTMDQAAAIGYDSVLMTMIILYISGSVLALQTAVKFAQTGADRYVGGLVTLAIVREIAPMFTALTVGARSGTAIGAEIANMQVTQQVDALKVLQVSPVYYLLVPRLLACLISLPLLTILGEVIGTLGGMLLVQNVTHLNYRQFLDSVWLTLAPYDIEISLVKAAIFGVLIACISGTIGMMTTGGAKDVGKATTKSAVWISITVIILDFFLTWIFFGASHG